MKTLSILRHAKSSWEYPDLSDFERPLLNKGVKRTLLICKVLAENNSIPELIITSSAKRAKETAKIVLDKLNVPLHNLKKNKEFYPGYAKTFLKEISDVDKNISHLMIVGHNPGLTDLAYQLVKDENIDWIPTSGLVQITFDCEEWSEIDFSNAKLLNYLIPKQLKHNSTLK